MLRRLLLGLALAALPTVTCAQEYSPASTVNAAPKKISNIETTALLGASAVYTGPWHDTTLDNTTYVRLSIATPAQAGASNGIQLQGSDDTSVALLTQTLFQVGTVNANAPYVVQGAIPFRYWRVVYTNGATAQTGTFEIASTAFAGVNPSISSAYQINSVTGGNATPTTAIGSATGTGTANVTGGPADAQSSAAISALMTLGFGYGYNGATWDRNRADPGGVGVQRMTNGAVSTVAIAAAVAGNTVVKATAGRAVTVVVTATGTNPLVCYDNASAASGTIILYVPASAALGSTYPSELPAANGITCAGNAANPGVTIGYN